MPVRIHYSRPQDLVVDHDGQFVNGGVLARIDHRPPVGTEVQLILELAAGRAVLGASVLQDLGPAGVALSFDKGDAALAELVAAARRAPPTEGAAPAHEWLDEGAADKGTADQGKQSRAAKLQNAFQKIKTASMTEKIHMAKHGSKSERAAVIRDPNKTLHQYVIRNPHLQLDEVGQMARMTAVSPDVLKFIADKREWYQRPEIAVALARNPRTPVPIAARVLRHVSKNELRQIAKGNGVRAAVAAAARKILIR